MKDLKLPQKAYKQHHKNKQTKSAHPLEKESKSQIIFDAVSATISEYQASEEGGELIVLHSVPIMKNKRGIVSIKAGDNVVQKGRIAGVIPGTGIDTNIKVVDENINGFVKNKVLQKGRIARVIPRTGIDRNINFNFKKIGRVQKKIKENFEISSSLAIKLKKSLVNDSHLKKLSIDEVNNFFYKTFFKSLGFYQASMEINRVQKYYVYKDNEFDFYIDMLICKEFPIMIGHKENIYDTLYEELYLFLRNKNIRIGEFSKLIEDKGNIVIETTEILSPLGDIIPAKSKKIRFKNE